MKVEFLKDHGSFKAGQQTEGLEAGLSNYLKRCSVVKEVRETSDVVPKEVVVNAEILATVVDDKSKDVLIEEAKVEGVELDVKDDKKATTKKTKEEKITKETK